MSRYSDYKDSGIEWIDEIPKHWSVKKISHVTTNIGSGTTPKSDNMAYYDGGEINWLVTGDLNDWYIYETTNKITPQAIKDHSSLKTYPSDSLMMAMYGATIGKLGILKTPSTVNQATCVLTINENNSTEFWFYIFLGHRNYIISLGYGGGQPNISQEVIRSLRFPAPSSKLEQKKISQYLDKKTKKIDSLIEKTQRKIELLKEQQTATINHYVTKGLDPTVKMKDSGIEWIGEIPKHWVLTKLKFKLKKIGSGVTPRGGSEVYTDEGVMFLRSQNIHFEGLALEDVVRITPETHLEMSGSIIQMNDVLLNITGGSIGRCCVVDIKDDFNVNQHVCILRPTELINSYFLFYYLRSDIGQTQIFMNLTGSGREGLNFENLGNFILPLCSIHEQLNIGKRIKEVDQAYISIIEKESKRIELLKEYRQSLISNVVTGKVRVTEEVI